MLIPMRKATLYALQADREAILLALQKTGEFMPVLAEDETRLPGCLEKEQSMQRVGSALKFVSRYQKQRKFFEPRMQVNLTDFRSYDERASTLTDLADELAEKMNQLKNEIITLNSQVEQLKPWLTLPESLANLTDTVSTKVLLGFLPPEKKDAVQSGLANYVDTWATFYEAAEEGAALLVIVHQAQAEPVLIFLKENNFNETRLPKEALTAQELTEKLLREIAAKEQQTENLKAQAERLAEERDCLKKLYDREATDYERLSVKGEETEQTFRLTGWLRYDKEKKISQAISSVTEAYELSFRNPEAGEEIPSVTVNNKLVEPYEAITNLYSRPLATGIDPNPTMAPFYFLFFGMMLSDAGYGVVLTIIMFLLNRIFKGEGMAGKLVQVVLMGAISTIMWGALFGGWFGVEFMPLLFVPMQEPIKMLLLCYALGAAHMFLGMCVKMYMEIERGKVFDAIVDQLSWIVMLTGIVLYVVMPASPLGKYLGFSGMLVILLFAGRENTNIIKRLLGGITSLYNITGYLSDVLSYSRLFALGLATGVIGMVINTIGGMLWDSGLIGQVFAVLVLLGGHTFNIAVNLLGAYVHTSRLQFIEYFGKFYEPGGREFKPLAFKTKYVDIVK